MIGSREERHWSSVLLALMRDSRTKHRQSRRREEDGCPPCRICSAQLNIPHINKAQQLPFTLPLPSFVARTCSHARTTLPVLPTRRPPPASIWTSLGPPLPPHDTLATYISLSPQAPARSTPAFSCSPARLYLTLHDALPVGQPVASPNACQQALCSSVLSVAREIRGRTDPDR